MTSTQRLWARIRENAAIAAALVAQIECNKAFYNHLRFRIEPKMEQPNALARTRFYSNHCTIEVSPMLAEQSENLFKKVFFHEISHVLAGPKAGHGDEWIQIKKQFEHMLPGIQIQERIPKNELIQGGKRNESLHSSSYYKKGMVN